MSAPTEADIAEAITKMTPVLSVFEVYVGLIVTVAVEMQRLRDDPVAAGAASDVLNEKLRIVREQIVRAVMSAEGE